MPAGTLCEGQSPPEWVSEARPRERRGPSASPESDIGESVLVSVVTPAWLTDRRSPISREMWNEDFT
jgi:hypothetical protein